MTRLSCWKDAVRLLREAPPDARLRLRKGVLSHPLAAGLERTFGMPHGQLADYWCALEDGIHLHVRDFGEVYEAFLAVVSGETASEHGSDTALDPKVSSDDGGSGGATALGAACAAMLGCSEQGMLAGALISGTIRCCLEVRGSGDVGDTGRGE